MQMVAYAPFTKVSSGSLWGSLARALSAPHSADRYAGLLRPLGVDAKGSATITDVHRETEDSVTLTIRPGRDWRGFAAGQFVNLGVVVDGVRHTRCFSPCDSEHRADGRIQLTVKAHPDGLVSRALYDRARPGMDVTLTPAAGEFRLHEPRPRDVVLISGGSGITPVLAMARTLADEQAWRTESAIRRVHLLHYIDRAADLVHAAELRRLGALPGIGVTVVTADGAVDGGPGAHGLTGRFAADHLDLRVPWAFGPDSVAETYLCGPAPMMDAVRAVYADRGREDHLHTEAFTAPAPVPPPQDGPPTGTVTFSASDVTAENTGDSLLEQAEGAGLTPAYGCRMGICFTCTAVRRSGCTRDMTTGAVDAEPDQPIQLCVSAPVGDVDVEI